MPRVAWTFTAWQRSGSRSPLMTRETAARWMTPATRFRNGASLAVSQMSIRCFVFRRPKIHADAGDPHVRKAIGNGTTDQAARSGDQYCAVSHEYTMPRSDAWPKSSIGATRCILVNRFRSSDSRSCSPNWARCSAPSSCLRSSPLRSHLSGVTPILRATRRSQARISPRDTGCSASKPIPDNPGDVLVI